MKFDITKPAFAVYINVKSLPKARAEEAIEKVMVELKTEDANMFFFPITEMDEGSTRIECIYNPTINQTIYRP